jgi:hypothetical protein
MDSEITSSISESEEISASPDAIPPALFVSERMVFSMIAIILILRKTSYSVHKKNIIIK